MSQINIICDLGGVFVDLCYLSLKKAFERLGVVDFDAKYSQLVRSFVFFEFETGRIDSQNFREHLREYFNIDKNILDKSIDDAWNSLITGMREDCLIALGTLKQLDLRVLVYSNNNPMHVDMIKQRYPREWALLDKISDKIYFSHEFGHRKPNEEGFVNLLKAENCEPRHSYFIDDSFSCISSALKTGMHAFHLSLKNDMNFKDHAMQWIQQKLKKEYHIASDAVIS
jgi:putative hydrolase of the HAD superfamily